MLFSTWLLMYEVEKLNESQNSYNPNILCTELFVQK